MTEAIRKQIYEQRRLLEAAGDLAGELMLALDDADAPSSAPLWDKADRISTLVEIVRRDLLCLDEELHASVVPDSDAA